MEGGGEGEEEDPTGPATTRVPEGLPSLPSYMVASTPYATLMRMQGLLSCHLFILMAPPPHFSHSMDKLFDLMAMGV